ncbi:MAG: hypothetical protein ACK4HW_07620 [Roseinatronobacter sp.]
MSTGGFNWDNDYEDLVKERHLRVLPPEGERDSATNSDTPSRNIFSRLFFPTVLCAALAGAYFALGPQIFGARTGVQTAGLLPILSASAPAESLPALHAYSDSQSRNFLLGLARFSDADLLRYAETTRRDLIRAGTMLAPFMRDALALTEHELTRRALPMPPAFGMLDEVRVEHKLRG